MTWFTLAARSIVLIAHIVWVGGFTFYGAIVIPILHEAYGGLESGRITQRVSDWINLIGLGTLALWWALAWAERRRGPIAARRIRFALLVLTTLALAFLAIDHEILDDRLDRFGLTGFYGYHRVYLIASTIQWVANLALVPVTLAIGRECPDATHENTVDSCADAA
jgi:hypothetical protein